MRLISLFCICTVSWFFAACGAAKLEAAKKEIDTLSAEKTAIESRLATLTASVQQANAEKEALAKEIEQLKAQHSAKKDSILQATALDERIQALTDRNNTLADSIASYRKALRSLFGVSGNEAVRLTFRNQSFDCYFVHMDSCQVKLYWRDERDNKPFLSLENLKDYLETQTAQLVFASNAGMYTPEHAPQGLFIQNGVELAPLDKRKEGYGNFYLQPNGVFLIDGTGQAQIMTTEQYQKKKPKSVKFATQSGPMLLIDGQINDKFTPGSENLNIRNGVGILDSKQIVLVISNQRVNFHDFASLFKEQFGCKNALYLDGAISETYLPELARLQSGGQFGPMFGITKK